MPHTVPLHVMHNDKFSPFIDIHGQRSRKHLDKTVHNVDVQVGWKIGYQDAHIM